MCVCNSILKMKNKSYSLMNKRRNKSFELLNNKKVSGFFPYNERISDKKSPLKEINGVYPNQILSEETQKKSKRDNMNSSKSLSFNNLISIQNYSSKLLKADFYVSSPNYNCDENCYDEEIEDKLQDENNVVKIRNELMLTNNMKALFIDSKKINSCDEILNDESGKSTLSMNSYDYELNFYRNGKDIRNSYLMKLVSKQLLGPNTKYNQHNKVIIFE